MLFDKFRKILAIAVMIFSSSLLAANSAKIFTGKECLEADFELEVSHPAWPMGLTKRILGVKKRQCVITITHQKLKVWKRKWVIDVCREPVHIKSGSGAVDVLKRSGHCNEGIQTDYCSELKDINDVLQDDGLIFAKGEKEEIRSPHGQIYCTHLLVHEYLNKGRVLSRHGFEEAIFPGRSEDAARKKTKTLKEKKKDESSMGQESREQRQEDGETSGSSGSF